MHVLGVVGADGSGTTATAVDLAAGLRREGHHAAVLDLTGDVVSLFEVEAAATLADALRGDATVGSATATVALPHGTRETVEAAVDAYAEALGHDETAFRAGDVTVDPGEPEPGELPVVVGGDRAALSDVDADALAAVRADLAFGFDYLVADAGSLGPALARFPDGIVAVTDTRESSLATAEEGITACGDAGLPVVGAVVNRATDQTDVSGIGDRLGAPILAVIPEDDRTPEIEPITYTAPETPAALAYGRLVDKVVDWAAADRADDGQPVVTDGQGDEADDDENDGGGLLGRLSSRFR
jgi:septum site-determining protein MinD